MAEEKAAEGAKPEEAAGGKKKMLLIVAAVLLLLGGGGGAYFFLLGGKEKPKAEASEDGEEHASAEEGGDAEHGGEEEEAAAEHGGEEEAAAEGEHGEEAASTGGGKKAPLSERLVTLDPFVVNLDDGGYKRFLKTRIELETKSPAKKAKLATQTAQMRDTIIVLLTSKRVEDLGGFEGKVVLKNEIERRLNDVLGEDEIQSVLITEFVIQ